MRLVVRAVPPLLLAGLLGVPAPAQAGTPPRIVNVPGAYNVRDLGGYRGLDGRRVRYGRVYRSANLSKVTPEGLARLKELGISLSIDFRSPGEVKIEGQDKLPTGVRRQRDPIEFGRLAGILKAPSLNPAVAYMTGSYRRLVTDPAARAAFARAFRAVATSRRPVLFHCTLGKDRTGVMAAILLLAVGVDRGTVYRDYLRSNDELKQYNAGIIAYLKTQDIDPKLVEPALYARRSFLDAWFQELKKRYGTFDRFLSRGLGIKPAEKARLRERLLG